MERKQANELYGEVAEKHSVRNFDEEHITSSSMNLDAIFSPSCRNVVGIQDLITTFGKMDTGQFDSKTVEAISPRSYSRIGKSTSETTSCQIPVEVTKRSTPAQKSDSEKGLKSAVNACSEASQDDNGKLFPGCIRQKRETCHAKNRSVRHSKESDQDTNLNLTDMKNQKDLKNIELKYEQTLQYNQNIMFDHHFISLSGDESKNNLFVSTKFPQNLTERLGKDRDCTANLTERLEKDRDCTANLINVKCVESTAKPLNSIDNIGSNNICLFWPRPTFVPASQCFGPWVAQTYIPIYSQSYNINTHSFVSKIADCQETSIVYNSNQSQTAEQYDHALEGSGSNKEVTSNDDLVKRYQAVTKKVANLNQKPLSVDKEKWIKYADINKEQNQSGFCVRNARSPSRKKLNVKAARHRRNSLLKYAGDVNSKIKSHANIQILRSKIARSDKKVKDLIVRLTALKQVFDIKSRKAIGSPVSLVKMKNEAKDQKVKVHCTDVRKHRGSLKRTNENAGNVLNCEIPCKRRRIMNEKTTNTHRNAEACLWKPESETKRPSHEEFEPSLNCDFHHNCKIHVTNVPQMTCIAATTIYSQTEDAQRELANPSDLHPSPRMSGYQSAYNSDREIPDSKLQISWARSNPEPSTTSCYPNVVPSYYNHLVANLYNESLKSTVSCLKNDDKMSRSGTIFLHLNAGQKQQHVPSHNLTPVQHTSFSPETTRPPQSYNLAHGSFPRGLHRSTSPNRDSQSVSSQSEKPPVRSSSSKPVPEHAQCSPFFSNNSKNNSRTGSTTDNTEIINPLSSPIILPISNSQGNTTHGTEGNHQVIDVEEYTDVTLHPKIKHQPCINHVQPCSYQVQSCSNRVQSCKNQVRSHRNQVQACNNQVKRSGTKVESCRCKTKLCTNQVQFWRNEVQTCTNQTENTPLQQNFFKRARHRSSPLLSLLSTTNTPNTSMYLPPELVDNTGPNFKHLKVNSQRNSSLHESSPKVKICVAPFSFCKKLPEDIEDKQRATFAFASGATVCQESRDGASNSGGLSRWLKSMADEDARVLFSEFSSRAPSRVDGQEPGLNEHGNNFVTTFPFSNRENESTLSQFRSCFCRHIMRDERQQRNHHELQQQNYLEDQGKHSLQMIDSPTCGGQGYQIKLPPAELQKINKYTYPKPPSELPFPPLSPFHQPSATQLQRTNREDQKGELTLSNFLNQYIIQKTPQTSFLTDNPCLVQQGGSTSYSASIFTQANPDNTMFHSESLPDFQNLRCQQRFNLHNLNGILYQTQNMNVASLFDSEQAKRQIESTIACHSTHQR